MKYNHSRNTRINKDVAVTPHEGAPVYRFNLKMPVELSAYIEEEAWRLRLSRTELINRIVADYAAKHPHDFN